MKLVIASEAKQSSAPRLRRMNTISRPWRFSWIVSSLMLLVMTAACTPLSQRVQVVEHSQARFTKNTFVTADGAELPLRRWLPKGKPKAVILALHGFNDYSYAFDIPGHYLSTHGVAVYAYDQRGFGAAPMTGIWAGEENLVNDLRQGVTLVKKRYPHTPIYVLGESMGGAVSLLALSDPSFPKIHGLILVAPAVWGGEAMNPLMRGSLWFWAHILPGYKLTGEDLEIHASDNIEMLIAMGRDPLVIKKTRIDAVYGLVELMGDAYTIAPQVQGTSILLHGDRDEVIPRTPVESVAKRFTTPLTVIYYPRGYHMLLRDLEGKTVTHDILKWIESTNGL